MKRVVLLVLKSPRFLYRELGTGTPDAFDVASRLSFGLWDSIPDRPLWEAAASGRLASREQVAEQARRMAADLRARSKLREFLLQWLRVDQGPEIAKDPKPFPGFDEAVVSDLRNSLELFLDDVITQQVRRFPRAAGHEVPLSQRPAGEVLRRRTCRPTRRSRRSSRSRASGSGVLTHPYLMASFAYTASSSPIHRGVFLSRSVLGRPLRPPPEAVAPLAADLHPGPDHPPARHAPDQARVVPVVPRHDQPPGICAGALRRDRPISGPGRRAGRSTRPAPTRPAPAIASTFDGVAALAAFLAASEETHAAFVQQLFHYLVKQPIRAFGRQELTDFRGSFAANDYNIRKLMVEIMASSALAPRGCDTWRVG